MSVDEAKGYVIGNSKARQIVSGLRKDGASKPEYIIKKKRLTKKPAIEVINELKEKGVIEEEGDQVKLTDIGEKVAEEVYELEMD